MFFLPQCAWDYGAYVRLANAICIDETGLCVVRPHHKTKLRQLIIDNTPVQVQTPVRQ